MDATVTPSSQSTAWQSGLPMASRLQRCTARSSIAQHAAARASRADLSVALNRAPLKALLRAHGVLLAALFIKAPHAQVDAGWRSIRGADVQALFVDHELGDGVHYAYQFRGNGTFTGFNMGKEIHGTWRLAENEFCWTRRKSMAVEECFEVERRGNEMRLLRDGYEAFSGKLSLLKAQAPTGESR